MNKKRSLIKKAQKKYNVSLIIPSMDNGDKEEKKMRLEEVCGLIEEKEDRIAELKDEIYELQEELDELYEIRNELWRQERRNAYWEYERSVL